VTRIIVADDHAMVREGVKQMLAAESGMRLVGEARNLEETLEVTRRLAWDVLILDYALPGGRGLQALKEIKHAHPRRHVLILSTQAEDAIAVSALRAGAAGYVGKESAPGELALAIRTAISGKKYISASLADRLARALGQGPQGLAHESLSERELRVMRMMASGKSITHIAKELGLSPNTVSTYRLRILRKLKLENNADLVRYAVRHVLGK
jgi:two-component system invasion response regulator UvrY